MASSYSTRLRLELISNGEKSGSWGTITNTNLGTLLEEAIAGIAAVSFATDANYTLTTQNGSTDEARRAVLSCTSVGSLTATRDLIVPTQTKVYLVYNNTTGGQSIRVKTATGTGITIENGGKAMVYCDGTNVVDAITSLPSGTKIGGVAVTPGSYAASGANTDITSVYLSNTGLKVKDTNASHGLTFKPGSDLTADRILTITTGDAARTLDISNGDVTISTAGAALIDDASASAQRTTLGLAIGADVQAYNANLTTYAAVAPSANAQTLLGHTFAQMRTDLSLSSSDSPTFTGLTLSGVLSASAGSAAAPSIKLNTSQDGFYSVSAGSILGITINGALVWQISTHLTSNGGTVRSAAGSASACSFVCRTADTNTGFYSIATGNWGWSSGGTLKWDADASRILLASGFDLVGNAATSPSSVNSVGYRGLGSPSVKTAAYTFVLADAGQVVKHNSASSHVFTIPTFANVAYPNGTLLPVSNIAAGTMVLTPDTGVTLLSDTGASGAITLNQHHGGVLERDADTGTNTWRYRGSHA